MPQFSKKSEAKLSTVHYVLADLCQYVVTNYDITILVGHRTEADQTAAYESRKSSKRWPYSRHNTMPSMAVDVAPWPIPENWGSLDGQTLHARNLNWKERVKFYEMVAVFRFAWAEMCDRYPLLADQYEIRFGADWDGDGDYRDQKFDDLVHIEVVEKKL